MTLSNYANHRILQSVQFDLKPLSQRTLSGRAAPAPPVQHLPPGESHARGRPAPAPEPRPRRRTAPSNCGAGAARQSSPGVTEAFNAPAYACNHGGSVAVRSCQQRHGAEEDARQQNRRWTVTRSLRRRAAPKRHQNNGHDKCRAASRVWPALWHPAPILHCRPNLRRPRGPPAPGKPATHEQRPSERGAGEHEPGEPTRFHPGYPCQVVSRIGAGPDATNASTMRNTSR